MPTHYGAPPRALVEGLLLSAGPSSDINTRIARKGVEDPFVAALFSVDPKTGAGSLVERGDYDTRSWEVDSAGHPAWRPDPGFLEGVAGVGLALLGAVSDVEPAWDRVLLTSLPPPPHPTREEGT